MPGGLPGSSTLLRVMTLTSSAPVPESVVHVCAVDALTPAQKLMTILKSPTPNDLLVIEKEEKIEELMDIDLNATLSCVNDCLPNNEKGKKAGVVPSRIIGNLNICCIYIFIVFQYVV